ncbi:MAG: serine protease [Bacteroidota bacterium]
MSCVFRSPIPGLILISLILSSCTSHIYHVAYPTLSDGKYDSEFPYKSCSEQLEKIGESIKLLNCIAGYKSYTLPSGSMLRKNDLTMDLIEKQAVHVQYISNTSSGTATVIYSQGFKLAVLTCAHIFSFPDTIISYFPDSDGLPTENVQSIAFRTSLLSYIADLPERGEMEILAVDKINDIAILGKTFETPKPVPVFNYPVGRAKELEWGTFVYMFGYPLANKMVTKAIVSSPRKDSRGSFLLDAVFNRGFSGGVILAIRDGIPNFELVGIVSSVPADYENVLTPTQANTDMEYDANIPYHGEVYVRRKLNIKYGVTQAISMETIKEFVEKNKSVFESKGYYINSFFEQERVQPDLP